MNNQRCRLYGTVLAALLAGVSVAWADEQPPFVQLDAPNTRSGYLARLLINETPFPGERGWQSVGDTQTAMRQVLWVLDGRLHLIPEGYRQVQIAGLRSDDIIDIITGTESRRQCEGFYRDANGRFVTAPRVNERIDYLVSIANRGAKPGRYAELLNFAQGLARAYLRDGLSGADLYAALRQVGRVEVTGHAYSWMTDVDNYRPGGNFVRIPDADRGSLGGNRFFTLRKVPR